MPAEPLVASGREAVLVAEDDPFVRSYAVTCLSSLGYRVVEATDGREALQKLSDGVYADILFTDVVMPGGMNGWELAERAREIRPGLKVLLTSGYALATLAERGRLPAGAIILNKPYRKAELAKRLREAMASSESPCGSLVKAEGMTMLEDSATERDGLFRDLCKTRQIGRLVSADDILSVREREMERPHCKRPG